MKTVAIVGYKKSGKTSLLMNLADELSKRGNTLSSVKHVSCHLDLPGTDTYQHRDFVHQTAAIAPDESAIFFRKSLDLNEIFSYLKADIVLVEGFKNEKTFPKIVCLRPEDNPEELMDGLEICVVGKPKETHDINVPILDPQKDIGAIADLVEEKAFMLPDLNCGACGYDNCYEMAKQIVKGDKDISDCKVLTSDLEVRIDGNILPLNPFVSGIIGNTIQGLLSSLKGYQKGSIHIKIP
jgi:molybdopterin-guanine dinucleotide biosynthesis protein B